ncbi:hypothetical protein SAMN02745132_00481 [Enterovibrio nigricans DSM 22720]|uniref:Uncharacterized protein n=1 Tax=Enterovibrio nigricans DSM 22720 TaxID=1121868 RepID=A0A1T4U0M2_9GAMM|nr:hypothetical protein SAMN02745132_00481 [Enterovibrio nigricans DSM 22720]
MNSVLKKNNRLPRFLSVDFVKSREDNIVLHYKVYIAVVHSLSAGIFSCFSPCRHN